MKDLSGFKVAIVCDWLTGIGGAERVVLELHNIFPDAPIYTSQYRPDKIDWFKHADVRTTWLQKLPSALKKFLPLLRAHSFSHLDLSKYDLVISSSGAEAKAVRTDIDTLHICYCHSPTHYYWMRYNDYIAEPGFGIFDPLARLGLKLLVGPMRNWDRKAARRPDIMIANSTFTAANIKKYYGRDAVVIHPPVETERFKAPGNDKRQGFVTAGRQTPYKRIDLAVAACTKLGLPLTVIGDGPEHARLVKMAGPTITFKTVASDKDVASHFQEAEAFIFPGVDDFGIVAVEAMAAGLPVIAYKGGGALDYVKPGKTGVFFEHQTVGSLENVLKDFQPEVFNNQVIQKAAEQFDAAHFRNSITAFVKEKLS